jgi:bifunctional ADP-heptose synthase (sugar kinase/adenylyltransferase)
MADVLVIGESCRDVFVYCDATRLAPDFPVPVLETSDVSENVGMAKNVQRNIQTQIPCDIITNAKWQNVTKTRYVHQTTNHMFFRVDSKQAVERIDLQNVDLSKYKIVVISDYNKGFLDPLDIETICKKHPCVFLDTKKKLGHWAEYAKYIKINHYEFCRSIDVLTDRLRERLIRTAGGQGCYFQNKQYPVNTVEVKDTSGAGDSFLSALVIKYLQTNNIIDAMVYANQCACEVVKHRGVTTI